MTITHKDFSGVKTGGCVHKHICIVEHVFLCPQFFKVLTVISVLSWTLNPQKASDRICVHFLSFIKRNRNYDRYEFKKNLKQYSENIKYVYRDPDCDCSSSLLKTTIKNLWNI